MNEEEFHEKVKEIFDKIEEISIPVYHGAKREVIVKRAFKESDFQQLKRNFLVVRFVEDDTDLGYLDL